MISRSSIEHVIVKLILLWTLLLFDGSLFLFILTILLNLYTPSDILLILIIEVHEPIEYIVDFFNALSLISFLFDDVLHQHLV